MKAVVLFAFLCLSSVSATCWGGRAAENTTITELSTCCWMSDDTCCAVGGTVAQLDIQNSLDSLVKRGLSQSCYVELANLECSVCSPLQEQYITYGGHIDGDDSDDDFDNQRWVFRICSDFCNNLHSACKHSKDASLLGANTLGTKTEFCESINGDALVASKNQASSIFGGATWVVSQFNCYGGFSDSIIEQNVGVCLTPYDEVLIEEPSEEESSPAHVLSASVGFVAGLLAVVIA